MAPQSFEMFVETDGQNFLDFGGGGKSLERRHDTQQNETQLNDGQHKIGARHNNTRFVC